MWMTDEEGLIACLLGPCEAEITFLDKKILIKEDTSYPYEFAVNFEITVTDPVNFVLKIRKPAWSKKISVTAPYDDEKDFIYISKQWNKTEKIRVEFDPALKINETFDKEVYFTYGPLVLAHPIDGIETKIKEYHINSFCDTYYKPVLLKQYEYKGGKLIKTDTLRFGVQLFNKQSGKNENVLLIPMGKTILRQVSFKKIK
jgi:hypothetical protein